jgi:maltose O-acetyltransferase
MKRFVCRVLFALVRNWPSTYFRPFPYGGYLRNRLAHGILDACGKDVNVERGCHLGSGRHISLGDRSGIGINAEIYPYVTIGKDVMMAPDVLLITENHRFDDVSRPMNQQGYCGYKPIIIEDDVWIGQRAVILPGVRLGRGSVVGACAVVAKDVAPYAIVVGNPARVVKSRVPEGLECQAKGSGG